MQYNLHCVCRRLINKSVSNLDRPGKRLEKSCACQVCTINNNIGTNWLTVTVKVTSVTKLRICNILIIILSTYKQPLLNISSFKTCPLTQSGLSVPTVLLNISWDTGMTLLKIKENGS